MCEREAGEEWFGGFTWPCASRVCPRRRRGEKEAADARAFLDRLASIRIEETALETEEVAMTRLIAELEGVNKRVVAVEATAREAERVRFGERAIGR